ncbi:MAG: GTP-binding protein, partial [Bacteroidetes bacterium]
MSDLEILKEIKKKYKITLRPAGIANLIIGKGLNMYALNDKKKIVALSLQKCEISDFTPLKELNNLKQLFLRDNQLTDVTPLKELNNLTRLDLGKNKITDITPLKELNNLTILYLGNNQLSDVTSLKGLNNLTRLDVSVNQISDLTPLKELKNLTQLDVSVNQISDLTPLKELKNLTQLDVRSNPIHHLPEWITDFTVDIFWWKGYKERSIIFFDNPLEQPPIEVVKQGKQAIKNYFEELKRQGTVQLFEAKLLVVGQGDVGKSWLKYHLVYGKRPETTLSTEGIEIFRWTINNAVRNKDTTMSPFDINFSDFGGQEIYHSTHQFFLTKRSLYLFVWEARSDEDITSFDYWLNVIRLLSDNAPVIVVMNKADERRKEIDGKSITDKFTNVKRFFSVSASTGEGIAELQKYIIEEITKLPLVGNMLPKAWTEIRRELESRTEKYITYKEYCNICKKNRIEQEQADSLSKYYHDLGVFLHFGDNAILREIVFLKPDWATKAVYKLLDQKEVEEAKGKFYYSELKRFWSDYDEQEYKYFLELMQKFELTFKLADTTTYIVPERLPASEPELNWEENDNLRFEYHYDFMPAGILTRLMVRQHRLLKGELYWKNGLVLLHQKTDALIKAEPLNRKIIVRLRGPYKSDLLSIIRNEINQIHSTLNNPEVKEMV